MVGEWMQIVYGRLWDFRYVVSVDCLVCGNYVIWADAAGYEVAWCRRR